MSLKILLVNPPAGTENPLLPLGLAYLAAVLEKNNIPVETLDTDALGISEDEIKKRLLEIN